MCVSVCVRLTQPEKKLMNEEKGEEDGLKKCRRDNNYSSSSKPTLKKTETAQKQIFKLWVKLVDTILRLELLLGGG